MPVLAEHHIAVHTNSVRFAAAAGCAVADARSLLVGTTSAGNLENTCARMRDVARLNAVGATGGLAETLRRIRHLPVESGTHPATDAMLLEAVAALREAALALDAARASASRTGLHETSEGVPGRQGELMLVLMVWSEQLYNLADVERGHIDPIPRVEWGPQPADDRIALPVELTLCACFMASGAMSVRIALADAGSRLTSDSAWNDVYAIAVQLLSWAQEVAAGATSVVDRLLDIAQRGAYEGAQDLGSDESPPDVRAMASAHEAVMAARTLYADAASSPIHPLDFEAKNGLALLVQAARDHQAAVAEALSTPG